MLEAQAGAVQQPVGRRPGREVDLHELAAHLDPEPQAVPRCGTWLALVAGFGGLRDFDGDVVFRPRLPASWDRLRFRIQVRGQLVEVDLTPRATTYRLLHGTGLRLQHFDEELRLLRGAAVSRPVEDELDLAEAA